MPTGPRNEREQGGRPPKALRPVAAEESRFPPHGIDRSPLLVNAFSFAENPFSRRSFTDILNHMFEGRYRESGFGVSVSSVEARKVRAYPSEHGSVRKVTEITLEFDRDIAVTPQLIESARRFWAFEVGYDGNTGSSAALKWYGANRLFDYTDSAKSSVPTTVQPNADSPYPGFSASSRQLRRMAAQMRDPQALIPDLPGGQDEKIQQAPRADLKEQQRRNADHTVIWIGQKKQLEPSTGTSVPAYEWDDASHADGIFFSVPKPQALIESELATGPDRTHLEIETGDPSDLMTRKVTLRFDGEHHSELEMYYLTLLFSDIMSGIPYENDGSQTGSVGKLYRADVLDVYHQVMQTRKRVRSIEDIPGLEAEYRSLKTDLLGEYPMDTVLVGATGSGKSELAGLLEVDPEVDALAFTISIKEFLQNVDMYQYMFQKAAERFDCLVVPIIDDAEGLFTESVSDDDYTGRAESRKRSETLSMIGIQPGADNKKRLAYVLTLNYPDKADSAFLGRVKLIYVPLGVADRRLEAVTKKAEEIGGASHIPIPSEVIEVIVRELNRDAIYPMREHVKVLMSIVNNIGMLQKEGVIGEDVNWNNPEVVAVVGRVIKSSLDTHPIGLTQESEARATAVAHQTAQRRGTSSIGFLDQPPGDSDRDFTYHVGPVQE